MDAVNQLIEIVSELFLSLIGKVLLSSLIGACLGAFLSITFIKKARKGKWMDRPYKLWTVAAKSSYIILPLTLVVSGIVQGGIWGVHTTANDFIQDSSQPLIDYAEAFLPNLQNFVNSTVLPEGSSTREIVEAYTKNERSDKGYVMSSVNTVIIESFIAIMPTVQDFSEPLDILRNIDPLNIKKTDFQVIPSTMKGFVSLKLAPIYFACFTPLLIYIGIVLLELFIYKLTK